MPRTSEELARAAAATDALLDTLDVEQMHQEDISDLRRVGDALQTVADGEMQLVQAVAAARANGRSWSRIGAVLGTSRQAAAERFSTPAVAQQLPINIA